MGYTIFKILFSGSMVVLIAEISKRSPFIGAVTASLPIISIFAMIWLWHDTKDVIRLSSHAKSTFWLVLPSLPMFLLLPFLLERKFDFYLSLGISCIVTMVLYLITLYLMKYI